MANEESSLYLLRSTAAFDADEVWVGDRFTHFGLQAQHKKMQKKPPPNTYAYLVKDLLVKPKDDVGVSGMKDLLTAVPFSRPIQPFKPQDLAYALSGLEPRPAGAPKVTSAGIWNACINFCARVLSFTLVARKPVHQTPKTSTGGSFCPRGSPI
jgi:hypothetical protein